MYLENNNNCVECLNKCDAVQVLTPEELSLFNSGKSEVKYKAREVIVKQGTPIQHVITLKSGLAKVYLEGGAKDLILKILKCDEIVLSPGIFLDNKHVCSISTITPCVVCFIEVGAFRELMRRNPRFVMGFKKDFALSTIQSYQKLLSLTQKQMHGRVAEVLLYLSKDIFNAESYDMTINLMEFSEMTSLTKESICRVLKDMKNEGIINQKGNTIEILNMKHLETISARG